VKFVIAAIFFSWLSYAILWLEYGVLNFGDSDLPPYQPDTPFERACDAVWLAVVIASLVLWLYVIAMFFGACFRAWKRRLA
jgi:hypothetical protein